jgi:hypothetical protein
VLIGLWRGTSTTPAASLADVVVLMGSPISSRLQFAVLMLRSSLVNALVIGLWALVTASGAVLSLGDAWVSTRVMYAVGSIVLLSEILRYAVWVGSEQVMARSPRAGGRLRFLIKVSVLGLGTGMGVVLLGPLLTGSNREWRVALDQLVDRAELIAAVPPMLFSASVLTPGGASLLSALALAGLIVAFAGLAIYWARDFVEPISVTAEHKTDPRGQMLETGSDVQWAALAQFGASPRLKYSLPLFGSGPWALLWGSGNRWIRYQVSAVSITLATLGVFGVLTAIGVRLGFIPVEVAWGVALMFPFFGSVNMFMDELRRQFIFMIPGSSWERLAAGAITSVLDGLVASLVVVGILLVIGSIPLTHAAGLLLLGLAIALLGQACLALIQILLPFWVGQRIRVTATFGLTGIAFLPALLTLIGLYVSVGPVTGLLVSAVVTLITGVIALAVAAYLFDRVEFSG